MKIEQRSVCTEVRASESKFELHAKAASFNKLSRDLGGFREQIAPGCFTRSLENGDDVMCLWNHSADKPLGRVSNGSLSVSQRADGLYYTCKLDRSSPDHQSAYAAVRSGLVSECSFQFIADDDKWEDGVQDPEDRSKRFTRRTLRSAKLIDVSPVVFPAYGDNATNVQARAERRAAAAYVIMPPSDILRPMTPAEVEDMRLRLEVSMRSDYNYPNHPNYKVAETRAKCECDCDPCREGDCTSCEHGDDCEDEDCEHERD
jgi:HK97 family phage prohead protease